VTGLRAKLAGREEQSRTIASLQTEVEKRNETIRLERAEADTMRRELEELRGLIASGAIQPSVNGSQPASQNGGEAEAAITAAEARIAELVLTYASRFGMELVGGGEVPEFIEGQQV